MTGPAHANDVLKQYDQTVFINKNKTSLSTSWEDGSWRGKHNLAKRLYSVLNSIHRESNKYLLLQGFPFLGTYRLLSAAKLMVAPLPF